MDAKKQKILGEDLAHKKNVYFKQSSSKLAIQIHANYPDKRNAQGPKTVKLREI